MQLIKHWMKFFGLLRRSEMFKKIKDERLILKNLKNIRIAFVIQTIGIIGILIYTGITKGVREITNDPLWFVFIITMIVFLLLTMRISVDVEDNIEKAKKPTSYIWLFLLSLVIGTSAGLLTKFGPDRGSIRDAFIIGSIVFICFLATFTIKYFLRKKSYHNRIKDENEMLE